MNSSHVRPRTFCQLDLLVAATRAVLIAGLTVGLGAGAHGSTSTSSWEPAPPASTATSP